ncbi:ABC-type amino acid transport/signal transduction systems, periplasmic component/domain [Dickeya aquatica]|uniref:ABC-type amino acid transport/signal transduction systems, periplasmic component/domain n=2 Tax=Pectobacteriaceae TaxID=1903410 RepID=A0A375AEG4_9GAMM|nr:ABC-type amino acid transport/signal transduction systems, periplasmic component/domain [Dickeya aquatica]
MGFPVCGYLARILLLFSATKVSIFLLKNLWFQSNLTGGTAMKIGKRFLAVAGAALLMVQAGQAMADQLQDIQQRGVLRVAVPQDFPPFGSVGTDLQPQGYDIDMARYLASEMKLKLQLVPVTSANRVPYLQTDKVDLVISSLGKNAEREKVIDFSRAYAPFFLGVFGAKETAVDKPEALQGQTVGVTRGAVEDMVLSEIAPKTADIKRYEDNNTTLSAYLSGQVQYIATGNLVVAAITEKNPAKAPVAKFMLKDSPCYIGLKKDEPALKAKVNELIEKAVKDNTLNGLSEKWLKAPLPANLGA